MSDVVERFTPPPGPTNLRTRADELTELRAAVRRGPSEAATDAQHAKGKLTARERLELLFDKGTFTEVEGLRRHRASGFGLEERKPYTDGVITGWGPRAHRLRLRPPLPHLRRSAGRTVPRISLILCKAYGGAYIVMDSRSIGTDLALAWPSNEIAVMDAEGAANIIFRREIAAAEDPDAVRAQRIKEYRNELMHPFYAAERGLVDDVIDPAETRSRLVAGLAMLRAKQVTLPSRKHGNQPQ